MPVSKYNLFSRKSAHLISPIKALNKKTTRKQENENFSYNFGKIKNFYKTIIYCYQKYKCH